VSDRDGAEENSEDERSTRGLKGDEKARRRDDSEVGTNGAGSIPRSDRNRKVVADVDEDGEGDNEDDQGTADGEGDEGGVGDDDDEDDEEDEDDDDEEAMVCCVFFPVEELHSVVS
jgi:hypothetical protein